MTIVGRLLRIAALAVCTIPGASAAGPIYIVRTSAMEPTLLEGDQVLAPDSEHIGDLRRGDIVAFHFPRDPTVVLVKRLIGLPGDHVRIMSGVLVVNSRKMSEPYVRHLAGANVSPLFSDFPASGELVVPEGAYFVLGDNRDYSYDSRSWGLVEASRIIGLVREVISSEDPKTKTPRANRVHLPVQRGDLR